LVEKTGKSASHIYARLALLQLIPAIAEAFAHERITASHANLLARLPQEAQAAAFEQCWRKDWQDKEPHLLPAKHVAAWIQANLYLSLAEAPFDREDPTLNPVAGGCGTCPRRTGYNTALFADAVADECKLCGIWTTASLFCWLTAETRPAASRAGRSACSHWISTRRSSCPLTLSFTRSVGSAARLSQRICMPAPG
jgi:hypothetical protein